MYIFTPYSRHCIIEDDFKIVKKSLKSNYLTNGKYLLSFENKFRKYVGSKYSVACSNGTAGIYIAYKSLNLNKTSVIIIPAINFLAAFNMANFVGSKIYLADVDPDSGQMTPATLIECIKKNNLKKIDLVVTMYNGGCPLNANKIFTLKKKYKFKILEDACHALGTNYIDTKSKVGSCRFSDICVFSFHPQKTITTGEGGMVTTNSKEFFRKMLIFRNHGIERKINTKNYFNWKYTLKNPSFNFRLSEINCALGYSQLKRVNSFIKKRRKIAKIYNLFFSKNINIALQFFKDNLNYSAWHLYFIKIKKTSKIKRDNLMQKLFRKGILTQVHYIPIFLQPKYAKLKKNNQFKGAMEFYKQTLSIPIYPNLSIKKVKSISNIINKST
jgi:dTDP-4-amino-4,6-dideoxygalactose transaminase